MKSKKSFDGAFLAYFLMTSKRAVPGLLFYCFVFQMHLTIMIYKFLMNVKFKQRFSGVKSDHSVKSATATVHDLLKFAWQ